MLEKNTLMAQELDSIEKEKRQARIDLKSNHLHTIE